MKTKLIQKIKEELNRHLEAFEFRFSKERVLFKKSVVKKMIKVSGEELIKLSEKAISQSREELVEEIKNETEKLSRFTQENRRRWTLIECGIVASDIKRILEDLNKK